MKFENLHEGQVFKNYKELCNLLEIKYTGGSSKRIQFKELDRYCSYHKEGHKIIIDKIYNEIKDKIDKRFEKKDFPNLKVPKEDFDSIGVYKIQLDNKIYVGSTVVGFRERFKQHKDKKNTLQTREMIRNGAEFSILEKCNGMTEPEIRSIENEWIKYYYYKEEYVLVNEREAYSFKNGCSKKNKPPKPKYKRLNLKVREEDYEELIRLIEENNLRVVL